MFGGKKSHTNQIIIRCVIGCVCVVLHNITHGENLGIMKVYDRMEILVSFRCHC